MGGSASISLSEQSAQAYIAQQFSGSCDIICQNTSDNVNIDIINSIIGGSINLTQTCSVNANCMISGSSDATSDIMFKAANSTNAKNAGNVWSGDWFNFDYSSSSSRQDIKQKIMQSTTQTCKMASLNQLNDLTILAANSVIGGSINVGQTGSVAGQCQLKNNLSAAASATAMASNTATSGKDKKGSKLGGSGTIIVIVGILGLMFVVYILAKMYTSHKESAADSAYSNKVDLARASAGCLGGAKALTDSKTGEPLFDPVTKRPVCPPPKIQEVQRLDLNIQSALKGGIEKAITKRLK